MGLRGPAAKPLKIKQMQGNPGKRPLNLDEPKPRMVRPDMPNGLSPAAQMEWERIVPELEYMGVLGFVDSSALAGYCQSFARWLQAEAEVELKGLTIKGSHGGIVANPAITIAREALRDMKVFIVEFGMTPASRTRIKVGPRRELDPMEEFLKGPKKKQPEAETQEAVVN